MIFHPEEYNSAKLYWKDRPFPSITSQQRVSISDKAKELIKFHLRHPNIHLIINFLVFILLFSLDWLILMRLPAVVHPPWLAGVVVGLLHGYVMYSLAVFTLHEGSAHKLIVPRRGRISRFFGFIANNISRIVLSENDYYARNHLSHHAHFTTPKDDEFLNFVYARG